MLSRATTDGAHTAFTDHRVRIRPVEEGASQRPAALVPWRPAPVELARRNLGLAYLSIGERDHSKDFVGKAFPLLVQAQQSAPRDPEVTAGLGLVLYLKSLYKEAGKAFDLASQLRPQDSNFRQDAAAAWWSAGDSARAIKDLEIALQNDPSNEEASRLLSEIFQEQNNDVLRDRVLDRYLSFRPQSIEFRQRRRREPLFMKTLPRLSTASP
jgi:tetratricopeptide (TPR) repeat protein